MARMCMPQTSQDDDKFPKSPPSRFSFAEAIRHSTSFIQKINQMARWRIFVYMQYILNPKESLLSCRSYLEEEHALPAGSDVVGEKIVYIIDCIVSKYLL